MKYAKIIVKPCYERRNDLVLRNYIRALKKLNAISFLDGDNALIYGIVDDNGKFYEMFTKEMIDYNYYELIDRDEYFNAFSSISDISIALKKVIEKLLFNKDVDLNLEVSNMEDVSKDFKVEFEAYSKYLSRINPYHRLTDISMNNECNNFLRKIKEIKVMERMDSIPYEIDEYEVVENPKRLVRK